MSTTTNFKRIALVAVAALGMGVLSSAPSQAVFSGAAGSMLTLSTTAATGSLSGAASDSTTAGTVSIVGLALNGISDSFSVTAVAKSRPSAAATAPVLRFQVVDTASSSGAVPALTRNNTDLSTTAGTTALFTQTVAESGTVMMATGASGQGYIGVKYAFFQDSAVGNRVAGTYVYTVIATPFTNVVGGNGTAQTIDVTVTIAAAAADSLTVAPGSSTAFLGTATAATSDAVISALAFLVTTRT